MESRSTYKLNSTVQKQTFKLQCKHSLGKQSGHVNVYIDRNKKNTVPTHRGACSDRQGNELSSPLNSCEKSGIFTLLSSCTCRCGCKEEIKILETPRLALERGRDRRQPIRIILIFQDQPIDFELQFSRSTSRSATWVFVNNSFHSNASISLGHR